MSSLIRNRKRHSSESSEASLEDGELINETEFKPISKGPLPSGRSNANLWKDTILEQHLEDHLRSGTNIGSKECTNRGMETYELPNFLEMNPEDIVQQQEVVNQSLRQVTKAHDDSLFNPTEDVDFEYGTKVIKYRKRTVPSDRVPVASQDLEKYKQLSSKCKRMKYNEDDDDGELRSYENSDTSRNSSRQGSRRRKKNKKQSKESLNDISGSKESLDNATTSNQRESLPIPLDLMKDGYDSEKMQQTMLDTNLEPETFGLQLADALGETSPELIVFSVKTIGVLAAERLFNKTKGVEKGGGMFIDNQSRRRTPGGVFLKLLRSDKTIEDRLRDKVRDFGNQLFAKKNSKKKVKNQDNSELPSASDIFFKGDETKMES